jgi:hypothetical protein
MAERTKATILKTAGNAEHPVVVRSEVEGGDPVGFVFPHRQHQDGELASPPELTFLDRRP